MAFKKLPINAKNFQILDPTLPIVRLYFGSHAWSKKDSGLIIPPHESLDKFDFRFLSKSWVMCFETGISDKEYWQHLALCVLSQGADMVHIFTNIREQTYELCNGKTVYNLWPGHEAYHVG